MMSRRYPCEQIPGEGTIKLWLIFFYEAFWFSKAFAFPLPCFSTLRAEGGL